MAAINLDCTANMTTTDSTTPAMRAAFTVFNSMSVTDTIDPQAAYAFDLLAGMAASDTTAFTKFMTLALESGVSVSTLLESAARMGMDLASSIRAHIVVQAGDEVYNGWIVNEKLGASAAVEGFSFNSFARFRGKNFAIGRNGIYRLGGATDNGAKIDAFIGLPKMTFGTAHQKRVPHAYIGVASTGKVVLRVVVDEKTYTYSARANTPAMAEQKVDLGKGLKGNYWQFELMNADGADFEIDTIKFMPIILERRI